MASQNPLRTSAFICLLSLTLLPSSLFAYGYEQNEDPLLKVFKAVIYYGKATDWARVQKEVDSIADRFEDVKKLFGTDLKPKVDESIRNQNLQETAKLMTNTVFLAIREKHFWNNQERLAIYFKSKVRLRLAEEYYTTLLAGNVMEYDRRHGTNLHGRITRCFHDAHFSLGSVGFFGAGSVEPRPEEFRHMAKDIESALLEAFPYFDPGLEEALLPKG
jgi:hypothetical protein